MKEQFGHGMDWLMENHRWAAYTLAAVALPVLAGIALTMPNAIQATAKLSRLLSRHKKQIAKARARLIRQGLIVLLRPPNGRPHYVLTKKGQRKLAEIMVRLPLQKRKRWNRKWHVLVYDIPEKHRLNRDAIRKTVKIFGCYQLQKNVWLYPYSDMPSLLDCLHLLYGQGRAAIVSFVTSRFIGDEEAAVYFGLR